MKDAYGFKWQFGGREPIEFLTVDSQKSFMLFAVGFAVHVIGVVEQIFQLFYTLSQFFAVQS